MTTTQTDKPAVLEADQPKRLRVWPGVLLVGLQWLTWFVLPRFFPEATMQLMLGGIAGGGLAVIVWWLFFSRAAWMECLGVLVFMPVALFATKFLVHPSIANAGMGMLVYLYGIPVLCIGLVAGALVSHWLPRGARRVVLVTSILLACGVFMLARTGGITGDGDSDFHWRWTKTPEEQMMAFVGNESSMPVAIPTQAKAAAQWPGFRGPQRDGIVRGVKIATDWSGSPPVELWRRSVGPGWSSFAVAGELFYTQEQRGDEEVVSCYHLTTGQPVWKHGDATRFWESNAGPGPRATPTFHSGCVYTLGGTGIVNALDAESGAVVWSRNAAADTGAKVPMWGFAGSPLVVDNLVIVATSGRLAAYDLATGDLRWSCRAESGSYSSPHLAMIDGVKQVLLLYGNGALSVAPTTGAELWKYKWSSDGMVQPALTADGGVLIGSGSGMGDSGTGVRRITLGHEGKEWSQEEGWTSVGLKPYFNDFVVHQGHAFGFDGSLLACIDLANGTRKWKGGRYGHGQVILLRDQDLLLVLSEKGEVALVAAAPDQFKELARRPAIEGKTWNHPVLVDDVLLVRNDREMAAFRLGLAIR